MKTKPLLQASIITLICLLLISVGSPESYFETNDDVGMLLIASGHALTSAPDAHIVFSNYLLGSLFKALYQNFQGIPWYGFFYISAIFLCTFFLNFIFAIRHKGEFFLHRLILSVVCLLPFAILMQFTKTAFLLGMTGYISAYLVSYVDIRQHIAKLVYYLFVPTLLFLSFIIRKESFALASFICLIFIVATLMNQLWPMTVTLTLSFALICFAIFYHDINYRGDWTYFSKMQSNVSKMTDYNKIDFKKNEVVFNSVGWSKNDFSVIQSWGHIDSELFSADKIQYALENTIKERQDTCLVVFKNGIRPKYTRAYIITALLLFIIICFNINYDQKIRTFIFCLFPALFCIILLVWNGRITPWVSAPIIGFLPWASLALANNSNKKFRTRLEFIFFIALFSLVLVSAAKQRKYLFRNYKHIISANQSIKELSLSAPIFVSWGGAFPFQGIMPLESLMYLKNTKIIFLSCFNQSPIQNKLLLDLKISDIFSNFIEKNNINLAITDITMPVFHLYMKEHYGTDLNLKPVYNKSGVIIYKPGVELM